MLKEERKRNEIKKIIYTYICKSLMLLILSIQKSNKQEKNEEVTEKVMIVVIIINVFLSKMY